MFLRPDELVSTATCRAGKGTDLSTGELLTAARVAERTGYAITLTRELGTTMLSEHYNPEDIRALAGGTGLDGEGLPSNAYMAGRRLGWACPSPPGAYFSDRFKRTVEEQVVRRLRQSAWADEVIKGLLATWPEDPFKRTEKEWDALWEAVPEGTDKATVRNRTRQVVSYLEENGKLPAGICDLEPVASFGPVLALAAADRQMVRLERVGERKAVLTVQLPLVAHPASVKDWSWVSLPLDLPPNVTPGSTLKTPTLRLVTGRVRADLPWVRKVPKTEKKMAHHVGLGYDWGVNTFITASIGYYDKGSGDTHTDGKPLRFNTAQMTSKVHRLRRQREVIAAKSKQLEKLLRGMKVGDCARQPLQDKLDVYKREVAFISLRQGHLNHELAWAGARWLVDQAVANHATVIYGEDLRTMENRGHGKKQNTRASNAVRSELLLALRHLARKVGIAVVTVPARGTSSTCPRCLAPIHHCPSPDRHAQPGYHWAWCRHCGFSADRDHSASERIVSRGLAGQAYVFFNRSSGALECRTKVEVKVRRSLRPRDRKTPKSVSSRWVRLTRPAPASSQQKEDQCQAGTCQTGQATGHEAGHTVQVARRRRYSRFIRAQGRGFHRNVSATLVSSRPLWQAHEATPPALVDVGDLPHFA